MEPAVEESVVFLSPRGSGFQHSLRSLWLKGGAKVSITWWPSVQSSDGGGGGCSGDDDGTGDVITATTATIIRMAPGMWLGCQAV